MVFASSMKRLKEKCASQKKALCQLYNKEYEYLGATSNLLHHLQRYHKGKYKVKCDFNSETPSQWILLCLVQSVQ